MAQLHCGDDVGSQRIELSETGYGLVSSSQNQTSDARLNLSLGCEKRGDLDEESAQQWAVIERLPTVERLRWSLFDDKTGEATAEREQQRVVDVTKFSEQEKHFLIEKLTRDVERDNLGLLQQIRERMDRVGLKAPTIAVRYQNLHVEAECEVVDGKPLPSIWNSLKSMALVVTGEISYNGCRLSDFVPQKTSVFISQYDQHTPEMSVREALDFSTCCHGVGSRTEIMTELIRREKAVGILPDPDIDTYMKAISIEGQKTTPQTDYILKARLIHFGTI